MSILVHDESITASDGYRLELKCFEPESTPQAWLVLLHGIQSHAGWYEATARDLAERGIAVWLPNRRGSGPQAESRGDVSHWRRWMSDVVASLHAMRAHRWQRQGAGPVILGGISWGGRLASVVAAHRPQLLDGLILLAPGLAPRVGPTMLQRLQLALARRMGVVDHRVDVPLSDPAFFTDDPAWQEFIRHDAFALHKVTTRFLFANQDLDRELRAAPVQVPTLLLLAGQDRIINNPVTRQIVSRWSCKSQVVEYSDSPHTIEFGPARERMVEDIASWLDRIGPRQD
ncbi:MAG: alpha/beta fold hydrolase [Planctomycetaceae bacterium]|nr:alpha/beta fold hydrolase [Planctomycetaceae bacterium]